MDFETKDFNDETHFKNWYKFDPMDFETVRYKFVKCS